MLYNITSLRELRVYIASDLYRYLTSASFKAFLRGWYIAGFRYTFFMRACKYFATKKSMFPLYFVCRVALRHYSVKYGYQIPWQTDIGSGLAIGHYGTIIVNPNSRIGANCNLSVGVLLGLNHKVDKNGKSLGFKYPMVGDRVSLGNGAKLLGGVTVSSRAVVGVHSVVTHDVGTNYVVVGNPARMISDNGSMAYVGSFHPSSHKYEGLQHL